MNEVRDATASSAPRFVGDADVAAAILGEARGYVDYLVARIEAIAAEPGGTWIKPKVIHEDPIHPHDGDIRTMACFTDRVKVIKVISTNPVRHAHWSVSVGATLLLDYNENFPRAVFDAPMMSALRTAGLAIAAARFAGHGFGDTCIVGGGRVGSSTRQLIEYAYPGEQCVIVRELGCESADAARDYHHGVVITATTSRAPFLNPDNCDAGFVCSLGADTAFNAELDDGLIRGRDGLYVDCADALHVGDLARMGDAEVLGDVLDLAREGHGRARTVVSVGSPLLDALTVEFLLDRL